MRSTISLAIAAMLASAMVAGAQTTRTETKVKGHDAQTVSYTGCVRSGAGTTTYMLENAVPISQTTTIGTGGEAQTVTTYALVPDRTVLLQPEVGHKVQVTGIVAKGDVKEETKTKTAGHPEEKTEQTFKGDRKIAQFHVVSMRDLGEPCS